jgi:hypothetical protein
MDRVQCTYLVLQVGKVLAWLDETKTSAYALLYHINFFHLPNDEMVPRMNARIL